MKSPVFQIIHDFLLKQTEFQRRCFLKITNNSSHEPKQYYKILLQKLSEPLAIIDRGWQLERQHVSIYEDQTWSETHFQSTYHYTGAFVSGVDQIIVHAYFDRDGYYRYCHVKTMDNNRISNLRHVDEANIRAYAEMASIQVISHVRQQADSIASEFEDKFKAAMQQLRSAGTTLANNTPTAIQHYLMQIEQCLQDVQNVNQYTFHPRVDLYKTLQRTKDFLSAKLATKTPAAVAVANEVNADDSAKEVISSAELNNSPAEKIHTKAARKRAQRVKKAGVAEIEAEINSLSKAKGVVGSVIKKYKLLEKRFAMVDGNDLDSIVEVLQRLNIARAALRDELIQRAVSGDHDAVNQLVGYVNNVPHYVYFICAERGHLQVIALLIEFYKFNINFLNFAAGRSFGNGNLGDSLLLVSLRFGHFDLFTWLLKHGANPNIKNPLYGVTPLSRAIENGRLKEAEILLQYKANPNLRVIPETCIVITSEGNERFIDAMSEFAREKPLEETPLHTAARLQLLDMVILLLKNGADPALRTRHGFTPFLYTLSLNDKPLLPSIVECFLSQGSKIDEYHPTDCHTGLYFACQQGRLEDVKFLVEKGADPNLIQMPFKTKIQDEKFLALLDICFEGENKTHLTPLLKAASKGFVDIVQYLVLQTFTPIPEDHAFNAYQIAQLFNQTACAQFLQTKYHFPVFDSNKRESVLLLRF